MVKRVRKAGIPESRYSTEPDKPKWSWLKIKDDGLEKSKLQAVSDLGFCAFNLPLTAVRFFERDWVFRMCTCKLFPFFFYANISISVFSLAGVALNRYVGLFYPHLMDTLFSRTKSALMVLLVWLCSFGKLTSLYVQGQPLGIVIK